jgi:hypothetical protein
MDYRETYLKEKLIRIKFEAELLVVKHEKLMAEHERTKVELTNYLNEKRVAAENEKAAQTAVPPVAPPAKSTRKKA